MASIRIMHRVLDAAVELLPLLLPALLAAPLLVLASPLAATDRDFGSSVRHNIRAQTVHPDPGYEGKRQPGGAGERSVAAARRYMQGQIRPLPGSTMDSEVGRQGGAVSADSPAMTPEK